MRLIKGCLNQRRCNNILQCLPESRLLSMSQDDIANDSNLHRFGIEIEEGQNIKVYQRVDNVHNIVEKYCYIIYHTLLGGNGATTVIIVDKLLIDNDAISQDVLKAIFEALLWQHYDRVSENRISINGQFERIDCATQPRMIADFLVDVCASYPNGINLIDLNIL